MKILNLYAGIGGNRAMWGEDHDITSVEWDEDVANVYKEEFPDDNIIIDDAHKYLEQNYDKYDFIWSSPPCQTHSVTNGFLHAQGVKRFPDLSLYEEIIYLDQWFGGKYCVENVMPYYDPLIAPQKMGRHYFWCNFKIGKFKITYNDFNTINARSNTRDTSNDNFDKLVDLYGINPTDYGVSQSKAKRMLTNCVNPKVGKYILDRALDIYSHNNNSQSSLF